MRQTVAVAVLLLGLPTHARGAEPGCDDVPTDAMASLADASRAAVRADDVEAHAKLLPAVGAAVRCLQGPVPLDAWVSLLFDQALVALSADQAWAPFLESIFQVRRNYRPQSGPPFFRAYRPSGGFTEVARPELGPGVTVWLDGALAPARFHLAGWHVLQTEAAGRWTSHFVTDGVLPEPWRPDDDDPTGPDAAVRVVVGAYPNLMVSPERTADTGTEARLKPGLSLQVGVQADVEAFWVRAVGGAQTVFTGPLLYDDVDAHTRSTPVGAFGALALGGRAGPVPLGVQVSGVWPSRIGVEGIVGGWFASPQVGVELQAGVHILTDGIVEPTVGVGAVYAPAVWRSP